jgi:hypothetical protein
MNEQESKARLDVVSDVDESYSSDAQVLSSHFCGLLVSDFDQLSASTLKVIWTTGPPGRQFTFRGCSLPDRDASPAHWHSGISKNHIRETRPFREGNTEIRTPDRRVTCNREKQRSR